MSQQIQISGGAKVRNLQDVIIGTSGVLSSLAFDVANGVPKLDSNGKILVSQLPNSVMEYKGTWNAATNTPTLANGTGNQGDVYLCNVAGTVDFGAGPISFIVGDSAVYSGSIWQRSGGATGTVTSVGLSTNGGAITIGNSPITTSGTITANFNGTNLQYVNGAGNLTTFPTLITSIGLSMPSAFSVANSPLTANGTIAVTGAGTTAQYIRGDGSLATFPTIATEAQRLITEVYNETGATLSKGTVVYINGGHGNLPTITKAIATGDATSAQTYGVVQTDITNMNNGYVVVIGSLTDLDTSAYVEGTQLYLSSTTAGAWTSVKQYAPAHLVYVAIVTRSHPTQGVVEVMIQNGFEMDELHNVSAQSPLNNQGLFYNTSTSLWENKSIATALGYTPADDSLVVHLAGTETITGVKNFNIGLTLQTGYYPTPALGYVGLGSNGSGITILTKPVSTVYNNNLQFSAASNTYNFPNASGTLALTSALSNYVDLTTAQTIGGTKTFSDATKNNGGIFLQNASSSSLAGYMNIGGLTNGVKFTSGGGVSNTFTLPSATGYDYTFPNGTGTIALTSNLSSYVPYTGATSQVDIDYYTFLAGNIYSKQGSFLLNQTGTRATTVGYTTFASQTASGKYGFIIDNGNTGVNQQLLFNNAASYVYTFPNATGTLALTSDLTGGTVTSVAALTIGTSGTDLSSSVANSTTTPVITLNVPTASATNRGALSSADWTTFNNKQSALTNPVTGTGTTNYLPKFTGTSTIGNSVIQEASGSIGINVSPVADLQVGKSSGVTIAMSNSSSVTSGTRGGISWYNSNVSTVADIRAVAVTDNVGTQLEFYTRPAAGSLTQVMTLSSTGNLGLGVTPSAWQNTFGSTAFQLYGSYIYGYRDTNLLIGNNAYYDGTWKYYASSIGATKFNMGNGAYDWSIAPSGTAGNAISFTQAMTLDAIGKLGLGVTPTGKLHIALPTYSNEDTDSQQAIFGVASGYGVRIGYNEAGNYGVINSLKPGVAWGNLVLQSGGGNILIGTTTNAGYKLDVNGTGRFSNVLSVFVAGNDTRLANFSTSTYGSSRGLRINSYQSSNGGQDCAIEFDSGVGGYGGFKLSNSGTAMLTLLATGAATFTATTGASLKNVTSDFYASLDLKHTGGANAGQWNIQSVSGTEIGATAGACFGIYSTTATAYRLFINGGGNIGIGTTTDSGYKLDVNGTGRFSGALTGTTATFSARILVGNSMFLGEIVSSYSLIETTSGNGIWLRPAGGSDPTGLKIATTGAATFSSSVTATSFFESSSIVGKNIIATNPLLALDIDVIKYTRKNDESKDIRYGYSAEQIHSLMPELTDKDVSAVKYLDVHTILIANLQKEIKELKAKLN